jgi:hypothetical protein
VATPLPSDESGPTFLLAVVTTALVAVAVLLVVLELVV